MNILRPRLNQNRHELRSQFRKLFNFCAYAGFLTLFVCLFSLTLGAEDTETEGASVATSSPETQTTGNTIQKANSVEETSSAPETTKEEITGTSKKMERYEKQGITILIDEAKTVRYNEEGVEIGFLNADKITLKANTETGQTMEIVAEGNVEIRDQDIFATCDHAIMNNLTNTITLKENVVVLQNKDRLETKLFTFNRTTGKQTGEGGVKFKVTVTQAAPVTPEAEEDSGTDANTGEEETPTTDPQTTENKSETDIESDGEEKPEAAPENTEETDSKGESDTDTESSPEAAPENIEETDSKGESDTDTESSDDADANAEAEESETN